MSDNNSSSLLFKYTTNNNDTSSLLKKENFIEAESDATSSEHEELIMDCESPEPIVKSHDMAWKGRQNQNSSGGYSNRTGNRSRDRY